MATQQRLIDAEAFWELIQQPQYAETLLELVEGELIEMPKPSGLHGVVTMRIGRYIDVFAVEHDLGYVTAAETGYILKKNPDGRDTVRGLDCGFIRKDRLPDGIPDKLIPIAPDLAVEVISPVNTAGDIHNKVDELLEAGSEMIWLIYPNSKRIDIHTQDGLIRLKVSNTLDGGDVLPGFELPIADIFPKSP